LEVYEDAGEYDLADEFRENLARKRRLCGEFDSVSKLPIGTKVVDVPIEPAASGKQHSNRKGNKE
jgi:hypothetical protein